MIPLLEMCKIIYVRYCLCIFIVYFGDDAENLAESRERTNHVVRHSVLTRGSLCLPSSVSLYYTQDISKCNVKLTKINKSNRAKLNAY